MENNRMLHISMAGSRKATFWPENDLMWSEFVEMLRVPVRSAETLEEYLHFPKPKQDELKDVGGFVGGTFAGGRRKAANVQGRDLITLDLDNIPAGQTGDILRRVHGLGCAALVYSTRKHAPWAPRLRIIVPLDKTASADQYEPAARKLASMIGMEFCDPTTFEASRLMYKGSCCRDSEYVFDVTDAPFCSLDGLLAMYGDWRDVSQWPQVPGAEALERRRVTKQEDPTQKGGIVGAFCRTYTVTQAIDKFLPGVYEPTDTPGRYTYTGGSTAGGAVIYDGDLFLYSHHATDPCSGQLVNAFDLVRLHKFGDRDDEAREGTPGNRLPSFEAMTAFALNDKAVAGLAAKERVQAVKEAYGGADGTEEDTDWAMKLDAGKNGYKNTLGNAVILLSCDPALKGKVAMDEFASCGIVTGALPWGDPGVPRRWREADDAELCAYMERYGITGSERIANALTIVSERNRINAVREYLEGLEWDGGARVDTLLTDYLGAEDNIYTRAVMRKSLCAAVSRAIEGGSKFDTMLIMTGPQGIGKSTFLSLLGKDWFSDSLTTFEGKDAAELIQGVWIVEVGELAAFSKAETASIKQFLSKTHDIYRAAYGRRTEKYPRRCVFFGTSNDTEFLRDTTGNRRFWPVDVGVNPAAKSVWNDLSGEVDQIWAEAVVRWRMGEPLFLSGEAEKAALEQQAGHAEMSGKEGIIREFLEKPIPENWDDVSPQMKRQFLNGQAPVPEGTVLHKRDKICAVEVWVECFGMEPRYMQRRDSIEINAVLADTKGWKKNKAMRRYGKYGAQRGFERV